MNESENWKIIDDQEAEIEKLRQQTKDLKDGIDGPNMSYEEIIGVINLMKQDYSLTNDEDWALTLAIECVEFCSHLSWKMGYAENDEGGWTEVALKALRIIGIEPYDKSRKEMDY